MSTSVQIRVSIPALAALLALAAALIGPATSQAQAPTDEDQPRAGAEDTAPTTAGAEPPDRTTALVQRARSEDWSPDRLFSHLDLDDPQKCLHFADRARLRERHARWGEAIRLLWQIDPDALRQWLLGQTNPPDIAARETNRQLECLFEGLVDAADDPGWNVRLFHDVGNQLDGRFSTPDQALAAADRSDVWFDRLVRTLTRSTFRTFYGQAHIWRRKFDFRGRAFNRISERAAQQCSLNHPGLWNPDFNSHRHCWRQVLSPREREREILQASAAPGLSRHHWGTDVDILSLNPRNYRSGGPLHDDWKWLNEHALDYGFFQTYRESDSEHTHMEERWHWSYYPVAQALWDFIRTDPERFEQMFFEALDRLERQWGTRGGPYFDYLREHWQSYAFEIHLPFVDAAPSKGGPNPDSPDPPP